ETELKSAMTMKMVNPDVKTSLETIFLNLKNSFLLTHHYGDQTIFAGLKKEGYEKKIGYYIAIPRDDESYLNLIEGVGTCGFNPMFSGALLKELAESWSNKEEIDTYKQLVEKIKRHETEVANLFLMPERSSLLLANRKEQEISSPSAIYASQTSMTKA